ncbi:MAG: SNF2-related protein [Deinococcales bacterium]
MSLEPPNPLADFKVGDSWLYYLSGDFQLPEIWLPLLEDQTLRLNVADAVKDYEALEVLTGIPLALPAGPYQLSLEDKPLSFKLKPLHVELADRSLEKEGIKLSYSQDDANVLQSLPKKADVMELSRKAAQLSTSFGFDELISLSMLRGVDILEHQTRTVKTVLRRFRGRAILADEVGMGKTIEAGMILLELFSRRLVKHILVLCPPSLIEQWQHELSRKFGIESISHDHPDFKAMGQQAWQHFPHIIASYHTAKLQQHRDAVKERLWDLVIIDEAHHLRNRRTQTWQLANDLKKKYMLLLTATPLQNNLEELFNLVTLLKPGLLGTAKHFGSTFINPKDKLSPRNLGKLHELLAEVMVRNRRANATVRFTKRFAKTERVPLDVKEMTFYQQVSGYVRANLKEERSVAKRLSLLSLQRAMGSSTWAALASLERLAERDEVFSPLVALAREQDGSSKAQRFLELLKEFGDKVVVFSQFRESQRQLAELLDQAGIETALFHGGLNRLQKEAAVQHFRGSAKVFLSTDAGSEGRNLQFCHGLINYDLPWNPLRIEQRVGRLSRIGQQRDVYIFNLVAQDTLEDDILYLLEAKINLFELVMGEMDMILGNMDEEVELEDLITKLWLDSDDRPSFRKRLDALGDNLREAKERYFAQRDLDDKLFGDHLAPKMD